MAYPTIAGPYGLRPSNLIGGQPYAGSTRMMPIASQYASSIYYGDLVKLVSDGTLEKDSGTSTATPVGVFMGCTYTDPGMGYKIHTQHFPANTDADDIEAYVCDDPDALFKVAVVSSGTTMGNVGRTAVGSNMALVQNSGDSNTGNSKVAVEAGSLATSNTLPIRVVDVVPATATAADEFVELIVKFNAGMHQYQNATGV